MVDQDVDLVAPGTGLMIVTAEPRGVWSKAEIVPGVKIGPGDVILEINNKAVKTPKDYEDAIATAKAASKKDIIARVQCGIQERCGDLATLVPITVTSE